MNHTHCRPFNTQNTLPQCQELFDYLSDIFTHARNSCVFILPRHNTKADSRLGCVLFLTALVPDCVKMSVGPAVARSAAPRTLQASAADESLTAATNHRPCAIIIMSTEGGNHFHISFHLILCSCHKLLHARTVTSGSVTRTLMSLPWPPMFCDHTGECGRESGQCLQFLPGP